MDHPAEERNQGRRWRKWEIARAIPRISFFPQRDEREKRSLAKHPREKLAEVSTMFVEDTRDRGFGGPGHFVSLTF